MRSRQNQDANLDYKTKLQRLIQFLNDSTFSHYYKSQFSFPKKIALVMLLLCKLMIRKCTDDSE